MSKKNGVKASAKALGWIKFQQDEGPLWISAYEVVGVNGAGFDGDTEILLQGGATYAVEETPEEVFEALLKARNRVD